LFYKGEEVVRKVNVNLFERMVEATVEGDKEQCVALAQQALDQEVNPFQAIQEGYSRGMLIVGDKFERLEVYLPGVMLSANAMNAAVQILKPYLLQRDDRGSRGTIILGTIQGDIHDLGKNIVKIMLQAAGFTVHDLGYDVPVRQFVEKAQELEADIIAASAMLATTAAYMPDIAEILSELGLRDKYLIMLGGTPVTAEWATVEAGADGYGENAVEAVQVAKRLMQEKSRRGEQ
jgi:dimethylamine corrinoid protein